MTINHWHICVKEAEDLEGAAKQRETWDHDVYAEQLEMHGRTRIIWSRWFHQKGTEDCFREKWTNQNHGSSKRANHQSKPVDGGEVVELRGWSNHGDARENLRLEYAQWVNHLYKHLQNVEGT